MINSWIIPPRVVCHDPAFRRDSRMAIAFHERSGAPPLVDGESPAESSLECWLALYRSDPDVRRIFAHQVDFMNGMRIALSPEHRGRA